MIWGTSKIPIESNGNVPISIQDQYTLPFAIRVNEILDNTLSLASTPTVGSYTITLTAGHGLVAGNRISIIEENGISEIYFNKVLNVATNVITLDNPVPYPFSTNATVFKYNHDMNVDGSTTARIFGITNFFNKAVDITRVIIHLTDATAMDDALFGGMTALTRGIVFRKSLASGNFINYWNIKSNGGFSELAYDKIYDDKAPAGVFGLSCRITYSGQEKHGVVIRLNQGESIQMLVQDNLTLLTSFTTMIEGHFTQD